MHSHPAVDQPTIESYRILLGVLLDVLRSQQGENLSRCRKTISKIEHILQGKISIDLLPIRATEKITQKLISQLTSEDGDMESQSLMSDNSVISRDYGNIIFRRKCLEFILAGLDAVIEAMLICEITGTATANDSYKETKSLIISSVLGAAIACIRLIYDTYGSCSVGKQQQAKFAAALRYARGDESSTAMPSISPVQTNNYRAIAAKFIEHFFVFAINGAALVSTPFQLLLLLNEIGGPTAAIATTLGTAFTFAGVDLSLRLVAQYMEEQRKALDIIVRSVPLLCRIHEVQTGLLPNFPQGFYLPPKTAIERSSPCRQAPERLLCAGSSLINGVISAAAALAFGQIFLTATATSEDSNFSSTTGIMGANVWAAVLTSVFVGGTVITLQLVDNNSILKEGRNAINKQQCLQKADLAFVPEPIKTLRLATEPVSNVPLSSESCICQLGKMFLHVATSPETLNALLAVTFLVAPPLPMPDVITNLPEVGQLLCAGAGVGALGLIDLGCRFFARKRTERHLTAAMSYANNIELPAVNSGNTSIQ